jgi:hypothetical protein
MKKILMALMLCLVSVTTFSQSWDYLDHITRYSEVRSINNWIEDDGLVSDTTYNEYRTFTYHVVITNYNIQTKIHRPTQSVLANYHIGYNCFEAGKTMVLVGVPISFIGAMCICGGINDNNYDACTAGYALLGIGGTFISVSVPLMCFGDHIKRECNMVVGK